jgi:hypothetical protein
MLPLTTTELVKSLIGRVHIDARALLDINLIWFGYIVRLSQWGGEGILLVQMILAAVVALRGGKGQHPVDGHFTVCKYAISTGNLYVADDLKMCYMLYHSF